MREPLRQLRFLAFRHRPSRSLHSVRVKAFHVDVNKTGIFSSVKTSMTTHNTDRPEPERDPASKQFDFYALNQDERQALLVALRFAVNRGARYRNRPVVIRYTDDKTFDCVPSVYIEPGTISAVKRRGYETVMDFEEDSIRKERDEYQIVDPTGISLAEYSDSELWEYVAW